MIRRVGGRSLFCCALGAEQDPGTVAAIQAYLMMRCRGRAFVEIGRQGLAVHFEQPAEADLFAAAWAGWANEGSAPAQIPPEPLRPRAESPSNQGKPDHAPSVQDRAQIPPQWGDT